jgi:hypothetical protein
MMRRNINRVAVVAVLALSLLACTRKETPMKIPADLELQSHYDLGTILDTTVPIELFVPVKNVSSRTITITKLSRDCSCTGVVIDKTVLPPGDTAKIRIRSNLAGRTDDFNAIIVMESDAAEKVDEIRVSAKITGQIRVRPAQTTLVMGEKYAPAEFTVFCDNQKGAWTYKGFKSADPNLKVDLHVTATSPTTTTYTGTVEVAEAAREKYRDYQYVIVSLTFYHEELKRALNVQLPLSIAVRRAVTTDPPQVLFTASAAGQKRSVIVQGVDDISIDDIACDSAAIKAALRRINPRTLVLDLELDPAAKAPPSTACELRTGGRVVASIPVRIMDIR